MSFSEALGVQFLEVDSSSWSTVFLGCDYHWTTPGDRFPYWDWFEDTICDISVDLSFNFFFPVERDWDRDMNC